MGAGMYRWAGLQENPELLLRAVARRLPPGSAFSGWTAAWLHGLDVKPCEPIEVTIPEPQGSARLAGARVLRYELAGSDIVLRRRLPTTSPLRTVADLGGRDPVTEGVVAADLFLHARLVTITHLHAYVADHPGRKGSRRLGRVLELAEPKTESAMETRLRMRFILSGLPRPEVQVPIRDTSGRLLGRVDLFYPDQRLGIEYDGANHRERLVEDNRRQNRILEARYRLLRFTAADVYGTPEAMISQVRAALAA